MSDSESDGSSSDCSQPAAKRKRADTYRASSTTSHGSALQSDEDNEPGNPSNAYMSQPRPVIYKEGSPDDVRLSVSSVSEHCSSPGEDYRPTFESKDNRFDFDKSSDEGSGSHPTLDTSKYAQPAMRMMDRMGYKAGKGLGKYETGRVEPVEASTQRGRRGLGLKPSTLGQVPTDFKWNPDDSKPDAREKVTWLLNTQHEDVTADQLEEWLERGSKKFDIVDETAFCDESVVKGVLNAKNIFDTLDAEDLRKARFRSNPYETIGSVIFLNRAAVKMANMDAITDQMFTEPRNGQGEPMLKDDDLLYFADVCAGPGGFSEYVLYKKKWKAKGFGFTLRGQNDFKLSDFYAGPPETFSPYYGPHDNGDIFDPDNLAALRDHVIRQTDDKGVHFLMADGGFSVDGKENIQEILSKQLYLCQCLAALMLVRTGGHFVVKLFDIFTPFSVSLVYLMYRCFDKVSIHKPVTSRPANSERYLICACKRAGSDTVERHLFKVNKYLHDQRDRDSDVVSLAPMSVLQGDTNFYHYIYDSNCVLGEKQIKNLLKIAEFCKDKTLEEQSQKEIKKQCLELWKLPDKVRTQPQRLSPDDTLNLIISLMKHSPPEANNLHAFKSNILKPKHHVLETKSDLKRFRSIYDWYFQFLASARESKECRFFLGTGSSQVYELRDSCWYNVHNLILPAKTLIYGEIVKELMGEGGMQKHIKALHVIDAVCLGGIDVSHLPLTKRLQQCEMFTRALSKPFDYHLMPIRCKKLYTLESFPSVMNKLSFRKLKMGPRALTIDIQNRINSEQPFHTVFAVVFFKEVKEPWESTMSRSHGSKYYYRVIENKTCKDSTHTLPDQACMDFLTSLERRIEWYWEPPSAVYNGDEHNGVKRVEAEDYILSKTVRRS